MYISSGFRVATIEPLTQVMLDDGGVRLVPDAAGLEPDESSDGMTGSGNLWPGPICSDEPVDSALASTTDGLPDRSVSPSVSVLSDPGDACEPVPLRPLSLFVAALYCPIGC